MINILFIVAGQIPGINIISGIVSLLFSLVVIGYWIYLMVMGFTGRDVRIPLLADWIDQNLMN